MGNDHDPQGRAKGASGAAPPPDDDRGDLWTQLARHHANLKRFFAREFGRRRARAAPWRLGPAAADTAAPRERRGGADRRIVLDRRGGTDRRSGLELHPPPDPGAGAPRMWAAGPPVPAGPGGDRRRGGERRRTADRRQGVDRRR